MRNLDFNATFIIESSGNAGTAVVNVYDNLIINAPTGTDESGNNYNALYFKDRAQLIVKDGGTVTVNGNVDSTFWVVNNATNAENSKITVEENAKLTVNGNANLKMAINVAGTAKVVGDVTFGNSTLVLNKNATDIDIYQPTVTVSGDFDINGNATFNGVNFAESTGSLDISGNASFSDNELNYQFANNSIGINTTVGGLVDVSGTTTINNATLTVKGADVVDADGTTVTATNTFENSTISGSGSLVVENNATFKGSNTVNITTNVDGTLSLDNASLIGTGALTVGDLVLVGDNVIGVDMDFGNRSTFDGNITFGSGTAVEADVPTISFDSDITFTGNLGLDSVIMDSGNINVEGLGNFSGLNTINTVLNVKGLDVVDGTTVTATNKFDNATFNGSGSIDVDGNATFSGVNALNIATNVDGLVTLNNATLGGTADLAFANVAFKGTNTISADTAIAKIEGGSLGNLTISGATVDLLDPATASTNELLMDTGPAYTSVNLKLTDNATVNVNGSVQDSDYTGSGASLVIDAGSTLNVSGNATFRNIITLSGNLNVDGVLDFEKRAGNLAETTKITLNKGAKITSLNDEILIANGSGYKTNVVIKLLGDYANVTDSALNGMTTNIIAGASANATNDVILVTFGFSSSADGITDYSTGDISLGNLNLGANQVVTLDFTGLEADTTKIVFDSLYVEDKTRGDVDYEYNNSSKLVFQDFEDGILEINTDSNMIFKGTTYDDLKLELGKDDYLTIILKDAEGNALTGAFTDGLLEELNNSIISTVPEPSTYAAIFGALALGLAVYRRRK